MKRISKEQIKQIINKITKETNPKRKIFFNMGKAFIVGGLISFTGEIIRLLLLLRFDEKMSGNLMIIIMISIASILTAFGIYDRFGQFAGCGTIIPITGFANSMTSSAMETKTEGLVVGLLNNIFKLAGSVIAVAILSGFFLGLAYYIGGLIGG